MSTVPLPPSAPPPRRRSSFRSYLVGLLVLAIVLCIGWVFLMLSWSYSDGERAGVLQKFSRRGWVCKTHEGELAMYVVAGVAPQIWHFSARDEAVIAQLNESVGKHVRLHYAEHRFLPTDCFGETDYFVDRVEVTDPPAQP